jgi:hypothetical protein
LSPKTRLPRISEEEIQEPPRNSPKVPKVLGSHLAAKNPTSSIGLSDFELLNTLDNGKITLGRKRDSYKLFALKSIPTTSPSALNDALSEEACLKLVNKLRCPILSRLQWSFQHQGLLYLVMVCAEMSHKPHLFTYSGQDFYPGGNLADILTRENVLRPKHARLYASEIVSDNLSFQIVIPCH